VGGSRIRPSAGKSIVAGYVERQNFPERVMGHYNEESRKEFGFFPVGRESLLENNLSRIQGGGSPRGGGKFLQHDLGALQQKVKPSNRKDLRKGVFGTGCSGARSTVFRSPFL